MTVLLWDTSTPNFSHFLFSISQSFLLYKPLINLLPNLANGYLCKSLNIWWYRETSTFNIFSPTSRFTVQVDIFGISHTKTVNICFILIIMVLYNYRVCNTCLRRLHTLLLSLGLWMIKHPFSQMITLCPFSSNIEVS